MRKLQNLFSLLIATLVLSTPAVAQDGGREVGVRVAKATLQQLAPLTLVPGTVVSRNDAKVASEVAGRLLEVADVGTLVASGDVIAKIEGTAIRLRRDELQAEVERALARLKYLEKEEGRYLRLAESNLAAETKLEETRSNRDVSRGDLQVAKSRLAQVEDQLSRTSIRAPFSGIVVERLMMPGERVDSGRNVVRMVDQQHLEVIARAPLEYYAHVRPGQPLEVNSGAVIATGIVRAVVAVGSENTHQFELRVDIESNRFPVGQTLRVSIPTSDARMALVVPRDALVLRPEAIYVFVVDKDRQAKQVVVTVGIDAGEQIEVNGDLVDGDTVIIRGNERLRSGQTVSIMEG
jgi:RND family efflux transporter MFP subunit